MAENDDRLRERAIELRIEAAQEAQSRSRIAFTTATIVSVAMIIAGWNAYFSFNRLRAFDYAKLPKKIDPKGEELPAPASAQYRIEQTGADALQREALSEWVKSRMITIAPLGIRVGVDDAPPLGAMALLVINLWFFFAMRSENYIIGYLLRNTMDKDKYKAEARWMVFHGVASSSVFTLVNNTDAPIRDLKPAQSGQAGYPEPKQVRFARSAYQVLLYLPPISIAILVACDVACVLFQSSPFRDKEVELKELLKKGELYFLVACWLFAAALCLVVGYLSLKIREYSDATECVLRDYLADIKDSLEPGESIDCRPEGGADGAVSSALVSGRTASKSYSWEDVPLSEGQFRVTGLTPGNDRRVLLMTKKKDLVGFYLLKASATSKRVTIKLGRPASVKGSLIRAGRPLAKTYFSIYYVHPDSKETIAHPGMVLRTDALGVFEFRTMITDKTLRKLRVRVWQKVPVWRRALGRPLSGEQFGSAEINEFEYNGDVAQLGPLEILAGETQTALPGADNPTSESGSSGEGTN
jgi:hypothetical protein